MSIFLLIVTKILVTSIRSYLIILWEILICFHVLRILNPFRLRSCNNNLERTLFSNQRNIHSTGNIEITTGYLVKEVLPIVRVCNGDVFLKSACPNALDCPILGLGHDIPNFSGSHLGNGCGFTVMPHCKVCLSRNVSLLDMTL